MKLIRSNKKGFGIHSPFVYRLVTNVLFPEADFYIFSEIDKLKIDNNEKDTIKLLFRILNYFQPKEIMFCGKPFEKEIDVLSKSVQNMVFTEINSKSDFQKKGTDIFKTIPFVIFSENLIETNFETPEENSVWFIKKMDKSEELYRFFQTLLNSETNHITIDLKNTAIIIFDKKFHKQNYVIK